MAFDLMQSSQAAGELDPGWRRYIVWSWDYIPFYFPSCTVTKEQRAWSGHAAEARVVIRMTVGLPMIVRLDDEDGRILTEILPRPLREDDPDRLFETEQILGPDLLAGSAGDGVITRAAVQHVLGGVTRETMVSDRTD